MKTTMITIMTDPSSSMTAYALIFINFPAGATLDEVIIEFMFFL